MIHIKPAINYSDFKQIETLADTIWREHYIPIVGKLQIDYMLGKYQSAKAIKTQIENGFEYFVLHLDNTAVGYISIQAEQEVLFLSKIYVLKHYRRKKIATQALVFIEEKAKSYQLKSIRLTVNKHNTEAIKTYEQFGFKYIRPLVTDIGNGFVMDDYEMGKQISH